MPLTLAQMISIPGSAESSFDHGAFEPRTRRVFVTHTGRNRVEVLTSETMSHVATLPGFPHVAGVVADDGHVLVTNRGSASLAWIDAESLRVEGRNRNRAAAERCRACRQMRPAKQVFLFRT
jgi:DNA-binding beta-propeller fold protein YncE